MGKKKQTNNEIDLQSQIQTQNADTSLPAFKTDDIRHYERKNMPKGSSNRNRGSK